MNVVSIMKFLSSPVIIVVRKMSCYCMYVANTPRLLSDVKDEDYFNLLSDYDASFAQKLFISLVAKVVGIFLKSLINFSVFS